MCRKTWRGKLTSQNNEEPKLLPFLFSSTSAIPDGLLDLEVKGDDWVSTDPDTDVKKAGAQRDSGVKSHAGPYCYIWKL
jgi:hypothetical protein